MRRLATQTFGEVTKNPSLLIAHGLFGSGRNWRAIAKRISADRQVINVDMRNHADSFWDASHTYADMANDMAAVISDISEPVDLLGHSMGGKAAMFLALHAPPNLNRLIVADIAPVGYGHSQISNLDIMRNLDLENITRRSEADQMLAADIEDAPTRAFLTQSLEISENGNHWKLNLDALANNMADIVGFPDIKGAFPGSTLFIKGGASDYIMPDHMPKIKTLFPNANIQEISGVGHWVHAEAPRDFISILSKFISA